MLLWEIYVKDYDTNLRRDIENLHAINQAKNPFKFCTII